MCWSAWSVQELGKVSATVHRPGSADDHAGDRAAGAGRTTSVKASWSQFGAQGEAGAHGSAWTSHGGRIVQIMANGGDARRRRRDSSEDEATMSSLGGRLLELG